MGFFDDFFGKSQKRDIADANNRANSYLDKGRADAEAALREDTDNALLRLGGGYDTARGDITTGADRARGEIGTGYDTARGDITTQYGAAEGAITDALGRTRQTIDPFLQSGLDSQNLYDTALGTKGTGLQEDFYDNYADNDPFRAYRDELANKQLQSQFNASPAGSQGGRFTQAVSRASLARGTEDLNAYLDRLERSGARGGQYATTLAGYEAGAGKDIAQLRSGLGDRLGSLESDRGTTLGNVSLNTGNRLGDLAYGYGKDTASVTAGRGQDLANLHYGYGQQKAGNAISYGNAVAGTRGIGVNNLLNLAGTAVKAFTPGWGGVSAFGSLFGSKKA